MSDPDELLRDIREKILAGDLPKQNCHMIWYGPGTGGIFVACEQPIAPEEVEVECDLPEGGTIRLHRTCYDIWADARRRSTASTTWRTSSASYSVKTEISLSLDDANPRS